MSIVTVEEARSHCRLDSDYPDDQVQPYVDGAEAAAADYLNRFVFKDQDALDAARSAIPDALAAANADYSAAIAAANQQPDALARQAAIEIATQELAEARLAATRTTYGIAATPAVVSAILLTLGRLFESRSDVVVGAAAFELSEGAKALLRPYRRVMMP